MVGKGFLEIKKILCIFDFMCWLCGTDFNQCRDKYEPRKKKGLLQLTQIVF